MKSMTYKSMAGTIIPGRREMSQLDEDAERQKINEQINSMNGDPTKQVKKPLFCTPNCQHAACGKNKHTF